LIPGGRNASLTPPPAEHIPGPAGTKTVLEGLWSETLDPSERTFARNLRAPHLAYREDPERVRLTRLFDQPACPVPIASRIVREAST
jgi:hypothetical protein